MAWQPARIERLRRNGDRYAIVGAVAGPLRPRIFKDAIDQLAALSTTSGNVLSGQVDPDRIGVMGHSAGGGTALLFGEQYPGMAKAIIPMAEGGDLRFGYTFNTPTMFFVCSGDLLAIPEVESQPDYNSLPGHKACVEVQSMAGATHNCVQRPNMNEAKAGRHMLAWMKLWLDRDWRYYRFICGAANLGTDTGYVLDYRSTCPA